MKINNSQGDLTGTSALQNKTTDENAMLPFFDILSTVFPPLKTGE